MEKVGVPMEKVGVPSESAKVDVFKTIGYFENKSQCYQINVLTL